MKKKNVKLLQFINGVNDKQREGTAIWKKELHSIVFKSNTFTGKLFDIVLLFFILLSTVIILFESVSSINKKIGFWLYILDWWVTISFTIEYALRIAATRNVKRYVTSFYGIIDLLSIIPTYLSIFFIQTHYLSIIRILRLLRIFRILRLGSYIDESNVILMSLKNSKRKIFVFLYFIFITTLILGALMYVIEGKRNHLGFFNIPQSMYWAIVTLTTVGYGDVAPVTVLGKIIASGIMVLGYSIISVPAGLVSAEYNRSRKTYQHQKTKYCDHCHLNIEDSDASYCKKCGTKLQDLHSQANK